MYAKQVASLLLFACVASHAFELQLSDKAKALVEECRKENNLELDQIKDAVDQKKIPETEAGKCFAECMYQKSGLVNGDKINVEKIKAINAKKLADRPEILEKANQVADMCASVKNPGGKCEFGVEILKCFLSTGKELGIPAPTLIF